MDLKILDRVDRFSGDANGEKAEMGIADSVRWPMSYAKWE